MKEHLSTEIVERFHQQALAPDDRILIYDHALECEICRQQIIDPGIEALALQTLSAHLFSEGSHEPHHLDYETIERYVDHRLAKEERNEVEGHLVVCSYCSSEVTDLRESLSTMNTASIRQNEPEILLRDRIHSLTRSLTFARPLQVSALIALIAIAAIAIALVWRLRSDRPTQELDKDLTAGSRPTPVQSPFNAQPEGSPLPTPGQSPDKRLESPPKKTPAQASSELVTLNDGPNKITLEKSGKLTGLESLQPQTQRAVREVLTTQTIKRPEILNELIEAQVSLRGPREGDQTVSLVYPVSTVIADDRPSFEWNVSSKARAFRVEVGDAAFRQVAKSEYLSPTVRSWIPSVPLKRGIVYTWVVRVIKEGEESPSITSPRTFKVLEDGRADELALLKVTSQSHLALGVFYAREGLIDEAKREFQMLLRQNPHSETARKLLNQVRSWQARQNP